MNYAHKELHEVIACLQIAHQAEHTLAQMVRAFRLGEPLLLNLSAGTLTTTALCPAEVGDKLLSLLLSQAQARVKELEAMEADCLRDLVILAGRERVEVERQKETGANSGAASKVVKMEQAPALDVPQTEAG